MLLSKLFRLFSSQRGAKPAGRGVVHKDLHKDPGPTTTLQWLEAEDPGDLKRRRTPERDMDRVLSSTALAWLRALPEPVRPAALASCHPRVVNRIALCWNDPELTDRLFDELLLDKRGQRRGFAAAVARDLMQLRVHHGRMFARESKVVWRMQTVAVSDRDSAFARLDRPR